MAGFHISKHFAAPLPAVFAAFSDFRNAAQTIRGIERIEMLTPGPVAAGTRFRETRIMFGREATEEFAVTQFEPNRGYTLECVSCGCRYVTRFDFQADGVGTRIDGTMQAQPLTWIARLMMPLGYLMMGTMKKCVADDLDDVRVAVEASAGQPASVDQGSRASS